MFTQSKTVLDRGRRAALDSRQLRVNACEVNSGSGQNYLLWLTESGKSKAIAVARCDTFVMTLGRASFRRSRFNTTSHKILSMATQNCNHFERLVYIQLPTQSSEQSKCTNNSCAFCASWLAVPVQARGSRTEQVVLKCGAMYYSSRWRKLR